MFNEARRGGPIQGGFFIPIGSFFPISPNVSPHLAAPTANGCSTSTTVYWAGSWCSIAYQQPQASSPRHATAALSRASMFYKRCTIPLLQGPPLMVRLNSDYSCAREGNNGSNAEQFDKKLITSFYRGLSNTCSMRNRASITYHYLLVLSISSDIKKPALYRTGF